MQQSARALTGSVYQVHLPGPSLDQRRKVGVTTGQYPIVKLDANCGAAAIVFAGNDFHRISVR
jgi:hypothetical protein